VKVRIFLCFLFLVIAETLHAQVLIGPAIGVNHSWISFGDKDNKDIYKVKPVLGYHAGFNLSFRVRKRFFLHSTLLYSTKGKSMTSKYGYDGDFEHKTRYNYLELPIIYTVEFRTKLKGGKEFKWYFGVGPNVSYWLGGKGTIFNGELGEIIPIQDKKYKIAFNKSEDELGANEMGVEDPNRIQLGLNLSAGLVFEPINDRKFMFTVRYEFGHSYLSRESSGQFSDLAYTDDLKTQNRGFRATLAYLIDLRTDQRKRGKSTFKHKK